MSEQEKAREWVRFVKASQPSYRLHALAGVAMEGERMLGLVLQELGLERSADLLRWAAE